MAPAQEGRVLMGAQQDIARAPSSSQPVLKRVWIASGVVDAGDRRALNALLFGGSRRELRWSAQRTAGEGTGDGPYLRGQDRLSIENEKI